jgi:NADH:ubiquinone oxidoreductase subunit C
MISKLILYKKDCLILSWFFNERIIYTLSKILGVGIKKIQVVQGFEIVIETLSKNLYPILHILSKHTLSQTKSILDLVCYDTTSQSHRFYLTYNLVSISFSFRLRILSKITELTTILSVVGLFKSANWLEREVFDFFGIFFYRNKDLRRILTDYGFKGFPLRRDFPLTGYIDIYYDDNKKRICYRKLELNQEYRNFHVLSQWKLS